MKMGYELLKEGGKWLGAARSFVQSRFRNGEHVTWGSNDVLNPPATIRDIEEAAAEAVAADRAERDRYLAVLREELEEIKKMLSKNDTSIEGLYSQLHQVPPRRMVSGPNKQNISKGIGKTYTVHSERTHRLTSLSGNLIDEIRPALFTETPCREMAPEELDILGDCERPKKHEGDHATFDLNGGIVAVWPQGDKDA